MSDTKTSQEQRTSEDTLDTTTSGAADSQNVTPDQQQDQSRSQDELTIEQAKAAVGKMSKLESSNAELNKKIKQLEEENSKAKGNFRRAQQILSLADQAVFRHNKEAYDKLRMQAIENGMNFPTYEQAYQQQQQQQTQGYSTQGYQQQPASGQANYQPAQNEQSFPEWEQNQINNSIESFLQQHPDYDRSKATSQEDYEARSEKLLNVLSAAESIRKLKGDKDRTNLAKYMAQVTGDPQQAIEDAQETGRLQGQSASLASNVGVSSSISTNDASKPSGDSLEAKARKLSKSNLERYNGAAKHLKTEKAKLRLINALLEQQKG